MTDKQIIIDGVDVSECPYYIDSEGDCSSHDCECIKCIHNVCFYKDYKAKEQECEELKKQYNCYACDTCKGKEDYINLKRHCENAIKSLHNKRAELDQLKAENEELKKIIERLDVPKHEVIDMHIALENEKLKQTLTEIKEIAEKQCNICEALTPIDEYKDCKKCWQGVILQKISEAENE